MVHSFVNLFCGLQQIMKVKFYFFLEIHVPNPSKSLIMSETEFFIRYMFSCSVQNKY